jgi:hypothetical protein
MAFGTPTNTNNGGRWQRITPSTTACPPIIRKKGNFRTNYNYNEGYLEQLPDSYDH